MVWSLLIFPTFYFSSSLFLKVSSLDYTVLLAPIFSFSALKKVYIVTEKYIKFGVYWCLFSLQQHMIVHTLPLKPYQCSSCSASFRNIIYSFFSKIKIKILFHQLIFKKKKLKSKQMRCFKVLSFFWLGRRRTILYMRTRNKY